MKHARTLGLLALAAAVTMVLAGSASASTLTSPAGTTLGVGSVVKGESEGSLTLDGTINFTCTSSTGEGEVTNAGGASITVKVHAWIWIWKNCGKTTISFLAHGTLIFHWLSGHRARVTWGGGVRFTVQTHSILGTIHCIYAIEEETELGTFTGSSETGGTGTLEISASIPREATDFGCGNTSELTGSLNFTTPDYLDAD